MDYQFADKKLKKVCESDKKLRGDYGPRMAELIQVRLADLDSAETLEDMRTLPGRCHLLTQNFKDHFALDLVHPDRLVFRPNHDPIPRLDSGGIDWKQVMAVEIVGIGDYH